MKQLNIMDDRGKDVVKTIEFDKDPCKRWLGNIPYYVFFNMPEWKKKIIKRVFEPLRITKVVSSFSINKEITPLFSNSLLKGV